MSWNQVFQENPFSLGSWWDKLFGPSQRSAPSRELTPEEEEVEELADIAREELEAGGVWYVYDKGRDDPVVYKVYSKSNPVRYMARKLRRRGGSGLRSGPWSRWSAGGEPTITVRVPAAAQKQKKGRRR